MTNTTNSAEREAFEAHIRRTWKVPADYLDWALKTHDGCYQDGRAQDQWGGWLARSTAGERAEPSERCEQGRHPTPEIAGYAALIHYPEHWDTTVYPTLESAVREALAWAGCSACKDPGGYGLAATPSAPQGMRDTLLMLRNHTSMSLNQIEMIDAALSSAPAAAQPSGQALNDARYQYLRKGSDCDFEFWDRLYGLHDAEFDAAVDAEMAHYGVTFIPAPAQANKTASDFMAGYAWTIANQDARLSEAREASERWAVQVGTTPDSGNKGATQDSEQSDPCALMRALCEYCGGTGDVHSLDGEWRGRCTCPAGAPPAPAEPRVDAWDALRNQTDHEAALSAAPEARGETADLLRILRQSNILTSPEKAAITEALAALAASAAPAYRHDESANERAIRQSIEIIDTNDGRSDERMAAVRRILRGAVIIAEEEAASAAPAAHWSTIDPKTGKVWNSDMQRAYEEGRASVAATGWKLVPEAPTVQMINAGQCGCMDNDVTVAVYQRMLDAAPLPGKEADHG